MMKYIFVILAVLSLAACRSSRDLSKTPSSTPEHTSETETKAEHYVKRVCANAQTEKTITARIKMSLNAGGKDISASGTLRMKRDDVVQLSLTFLGFEVARMEFSPNDVLLIDRYNKRYVRAKYSDMKFLQQAGLDFNALQALFWGELFRPGHESVGNGSDFQLSSSGSHTLLSLNNTPQLKYVFSTLTEQAVIDGMTAQNKNTTRNGKLEWKYADFTTLNNRPFPTTMKCAVTGLGKNFGFSLTLSRIDHATGWEGHTSVSSKYTPMKADDLLGKLINMK